MSDTSTLDSTINNTQGPGSESESTKAKAKNCRETFDAFGILLIIVVPMAFWPAFGLVFAGVTLLACLLIRRHNANQEVLRQLDRLPRMRLPQTEE